MSQIIEIHENKMYLILEVTQEEVLLLHFGARPFASNNMQAGQKRSF
ncbi:hypothetical protein FHR92_001157 [Fontibacillus solani]|uniref:Uncharacterized protein n=1 Tax=Fontibacillus solani TaxID=1572857 RepID=A0A7W3XQS7_9BACL|nr:hypothetical protein [Fontibacillus solani]MBA9084696.1 hypothetical protein [Fontibacillus solani]